MEKEERERKEKKEGEEQNKENLKRKILVVLGHPLAKSYCGAVADAYIKGALKNSEAKIIRIGELKFDPNLKWGYSKIQKLEPDLKKAQGLFIWADHIVFIYPTWWAGMPGLMKGFFDRMLLPGFGFRFHKNGLGWDKLLKGRSARIITTMMAPAIVYRILFGSSGLKQLKRGMLEFCGISPVKCTIIGRLEKMGEKKRNGWLKKAEAMGEKGI